MTSTQLATAPRTDRPGTDRPGTDPATTARSGATDGRRATPAAPATGRGAGAVVSAARIVVAFLFVCHGLQGLAGAFGGIDGAGTAVPAGMWPGWWACAIELVAGALVLIGLYARPAAVLCSGIMAFAYFTVHQPTGLLPIQNLGEPAVMFCWTFLLLAVVGPGSLALDTLRTRRTPTPH